MHFPIDTRQFGTQGSTLADTERLRSDIGVASNVVVITMAGKFIDRKRQRDLIEACRRFTIEQAYLLLIGSRPDLEELSKLIKSVDNVTVVGFVAPNELAPYYELTGTYAHVSSYDPHLLAVNEALASGCALVVSSATGSWGPNDDVRSFQNRFVVEEGNTNALRWLWVC